MDMLLAKACVLLASSKIWGTRKAKLRESREPPQSLKRSKAYLPRFRRYRITLHQFSKNFNPMSDIRATGMEQRQNRR
jgi:hypothetical protein